MKKDFSTLHRESDNRLYFGDGTELEEMFPQEEWNCPEVYQFAGVKGYEPMTAKELETEEEQDEQFAIETNIIDEKFAGARGLNQYFCPARADGADLG